MNTDNATPEGEALSADNKVYLSRSKRFFFDEVEYHVGAEMRREQADHLA
jgi:hypothetical protein